MAQITDAMTDQLGISLYASTAAFTVTLIAIFAVWYAVERTLSMHTIVTRRRELFYWATILCTFALGTSARDLATEALSLGFTVGVLVAPARHHPRSNRDQRHDRSVKSRWSSDKESEQLRSLSLQWQKSLSCRPT